MPNPVIQRIRIFISSLDRNTKDYRDRIYAIGSSIDSASIKAVDRYTRMCRSDGIWDLQTDVGVFAGNSFTGSLVKLKYLPGKPSSYSNSGYSGSSYSEATGIQGATNKYLNSGLIVNDLGATPTLAFYLREGGITGTTNNWYIGGGSGEGTYLGRGTSNTVDGFSHTNTAAPASVSGASTAGFWAGSRFGNNLQKLYKNGTIVATNLTTQGAVGGNLNIFVGAYNFNGMAFGHLTKKFSFAAICNLMSDAQMLLFYQRVQELQVALNRSV